MPLTVAQLMEKMPGAFIPEKAQGLDAAIQFSLTGEEPGDWVAVIKDGKVDVNRGTHPSPRECGIAQVELGGYVIEVIPEAE